MSERDPYRQPVLPNSCINAELVHRKELEVDGYMREGTLPWLEIVGLEVM